MPVVLAKIWLIGRAYAAAIERRRDKEDQNDDFYIQTVAPHIIKSDIDAWIAGAAKYLTVNEQSFDVVLSAHANVTRLFSDISGLEKRSLASKYLHFHLPKLFYIYDTRAVEAMRLLFSIVGRACGHANAADNEYRKFAEKCLRLQMHIHDKYRVLHDTTANRQPIAAHPCKRNLTNASRGTLRQQASLAVSAPLKLHVWPVQVALR